MKAKNLCLFGNLLGGILLSCGSVVIQEPHFYPLPAPALTSPVSPTGRVLRIEDFSLAPHLVGDEIRARTKEGRIESYPYQRWAAPLGALVSDALLRSFQESGMFDAVVDATDPTPSDWVLTGRVFHFEEEESKKGIEVRVDLLVTLRESGSNNLLWQGRLRKDLAVSKQGPAEVVTHLQNAFIQAILPLPEIFEGQGGAGGFRAKPGK
jgi:ABC-type uncharacterized transport system auxiliary subunit